MLHRIKLLFQSLFFLIISELANADQLPSIAELIQEFKLILYPGGTSGYAASTYRSQLGIEPKVLPTEFKAKNYALFSSIYYLLPINGVLKFHATKATKQFHHYLGEPMLIVMIHPNGSLEKIILGKKIVAGHRPQVTIPGNSYLAAKLYHPKDLDSNIDLTLQTPADLNVKYAFIGCTTAPSWELEDCTRSTKEALLQQFPQYAAIIAEFT